MSTLSSWKFRAIMFAVILAIAPFSVASHAEDIEGAVVVNVPFAFENGSQHFTPGLYTIRMEYHNIMTIRGKAGSGIATTWFDEDRHPSNTTKVVFRRYGEEYFIDQVWIAGEATHTYTLPSKAEKLEIAANRGASTSVQVAALHMPR
jgi:hypothetical protein